MAALDEFQFELDGYVFGNGLPVFVDADGFDPGDPEKLTQDGVNPITGARMFGRDRQSAGSWTFACHVDREDVEGALASAAEMGAKWRDEKWHDPDTIATLRYRIGGRTRAVFGKPRRFSFKPGNAILGGTVPPLASFDLTDAKHYDDVEQFVDLQIVPVESGGFTVPFTAPLLISTDTQTPRPGAVLIEGDARTAVIVEFTGPLTNGQLVVGGLTYGFTGTLPVDAKLIINAQPWAQSVTRVGNTTGVALSRKTRLARSLLEPGAYEALFTGADQSGSARCRVRWRNAHHTL
jgi:hypothetical protein